MDNLKLTYSINHLLIYFIIMRKDYERKIVKSGYSKRT